jgi:uncharacterized protein
VRRLELARADSEPLAFEERVTLPAEALGEELAGADDVSISGVVEATGRGYALTGEVSGTLHLRCARCLREFSAPVAERRNVRLLPSARAPQEEETQLGRDDLEVRFYDEPVVDLADLAAEQLQLASPAKPLCSESCQGLCPRCGADLNQGMCACPRPTDPRWTPLVDWRKRS